MVRALCPLPLPLPPCTAELIWSVPVNMRVHRAACPNVGSSVRCVCASWCMPVSAEQDAQIPDCREQYAWNMSLTCCKPVLDWLWAAPLQLGADVQQTRQCSMLIPFMAPLCWGVVYHEAEVGVAHLRWG